MSTGTWAPEFGAPFKIYIAGLVQASTAAPVATVAQNTLGAVAWARTGAGVITATLAGAFTADKTYLLAASADSFITGVRTSANVITFTNNVDETPTDGFSATVHLIVKA